MRLTSVHCCHRLPFGFHWFFLQFWGDVSHTVFLVLFTNFRIVSDIFTQSTIQLFKQLYRCIASIKTTTTTTSTTVLQWIFVSHMQSYNNSVVIPNGCFVGDKFSFIRCFIFDYCFIFHLFLITFFPLKLISYCVQHFSVTLFVYYAPCVWGNF